MKYKNQLLIEIEKGCGKIFGDSYYKDMNPRPCGTFENQITFICSDCRKQKQVILKQMKQELEFLGFQFGNEKSYDIIKLRIKELKHDLSLEEKDE